MPTSVARLERDRQMPSGVELPRCGGHLILGGETLEEGGPRGSSSESGMTEVPVGV